MREHFATSQRSWFTRDPRRPALKTMLGSSTILGEDVVPGLRRSSRTDQPGRRARGPDHALLLTASRCLSDRP